MLPTAPVIVQRLDYQEFDWQVDRTKLHFYLDANATRVHSELSIRYTGERTGDANAAPSLRLDGVDLQLISLAVDGLTLTPDRYTLDESSLTLHSVAHTCVVSIETLINPQANTALEGLYRSGGNFCTQCEAQGFRKITYYPDRPDVLSVFDVTIEADAVEYPVLLSNGNPGEHTTLDNGRHCASWHDPHPKPCYLFALVAGSLSVVEDSFICASGREVLLQIYVQEHNVHACDFAMTALKASMRWDEQVYGLEYDLERFMIVAVDDFNMGAMENKGLNVFNSRFVLAQTSTATDDDFLGVEAVIAHEYFHNWTGNRITCRDWFQLSLKEGLTVFRDQCFSADMHSATVKRIEDVRLLRARQFAEDAGPMAHPIRPDSYIEINNFYTLTVYEKGAEVIRMLHTLLGATLWRRAMDEYVLRHDGSATTCDAFIDAMQSVTDMDLSQFRLWYSTAGTPVVVMQEHFDDIACRYTVTLSQHTPDTPGQTNKQALHIPVLMGLLDEHGNSIALRPSDESVSSISMVDDNSVLLSLTQATQQFDFDHVSSMPTASVLRNFSAPVKLDQSLSDQQLALLISHDTDGFNRWEAVQRLAERVVLAHMNGQPAAGSLNALNVALEHVLDDAMLESSFKAETLMMPSIDALAESQSAVDYGALGSARDALQHAIAVHHEQRLRSLVTSGRDALGNLHDDAAIGMRKLANVALSLLGHLPQSDWLALARTQFVAAQNMTDRLAALSCLCNSNSKQRTQSLNEFYAQASDNKLVMDKWFSVQASARRDNVLDDVKALYQHPDFDVKNPNRVRALLSGFALNNPVAFHDAEANGYAFLADRVIELDAINPQVAARLITPLTRWNRLIRSQQVLMREQLLRVSSCASVSPDVYEMVSKSLEH